MELSLSTETCLRVTGVITEPVETVVMMTSTLISNSRPLQPEYIPSQLVNREDTQTVLNDLLGPASSRNIHLQGPRGTGKTHLIRSTLTDLPDDVNTCYIDCITADTQYKALRQVYQSLTKEKINTGYHTSDLQRKIEDRTGAIHTVIVFDEIDFILQNDGDDLLYYLSRMENNPQINVVIVSNQIPDLQDQIEERTYSSLQPHPLQLEPYTGEEAYQVLLDRAQKALKPQTLQRAALTYISSTSSNLRFSLQWLKTAAETADTVITETHVRRIQENAYEGYAEKLLNRFSNHHHLLYQGIRELAEEVEEEIIRSGDVYQRYQELCHTQDVESLSDRRISDYIKQLELLDLIQAEYHYGGSKGKTREIEFIR